MYPDDPSSSSPSTGDNLQQLASSAQEKSQQALQAGTNYVKENPAAVALGALALGVLIGALWARHDEEQKQDNPKIREAVDGIISQLSHRLHHAKTPEVVNGLGSFSRDLGKKLRWW